MSTFDDLMKAYLGVAQRPTELVTDYVVRLIISSYSRLCSEYPQRFDRNSQTQHKDACYVCGKLGHWRKKCPVRQLEQKTRDHTHQKVKSTHTTGSTQIEETPCTEATTKKVRAKKKILAQKPEYYNPDPMARLFGKANETPILINGQETTCLVDTGVTVTVIDEAYCQKMGLQIQPITALVKLVGTSGSPIPYSGYVVARPSDEHEHQV